MAREDSCHGDSGDGKADFSTVTAVRLAAASKHANQSRRLLSLAAVPGWDEPGRYAARIGGMDRQTLRDSVRLQ